MHIDYIIVGQGLAGSLLSYFLIKHDLKVMVYDKPDQQQASTIAAGIFNPFTGRKLVKTWLADQLFPKLIDFYRELESDLGIKLFHQRYMYRPFLTIDEQNEWGVRLYDDRYNPYIESILGTDEALHQVINPLGGIMLKRCGFVDMKNMISGLREFLIERQAFSSTGFVQAELEIKKKAVAYRGLHARKVIFCEGPWLTENTFFNWLPIRPVKGELLEVELEEPLSFMVNRGVFVLPFEDNLCKVGATFDQHDLSWQVTEKARNRLEKGLKELIRIPFKTRSQRAGVRPASSDRRPLIGLHPEYEPLAVFNGLGTKGVSLAPYLIEQFYNFLERGVPLIQDVTINRHFSLYYNKN